MHFQLLVGIGLVFGTPIIAQFEHLGWRFHTPECARASCAPAAQAVVRCGVRCAFVRCGAVVWCVVSC